MIFKNPELFLYIGLPALIALIFILRAELIKVDKRFTDEKEYLRRRRKARLFLFFTRIILVLLFVAALAQPVLETKIFSETKPHVTLLIDNSTSMELMSVGVIEKFIDELDEQVPLDVRVIGSKGESALGDDILVNLKEGENIILVTDGYVQDGPSIRSVVEFSGTLNATINAIELDTGSDDAAVSILGPQKAVDGVNNTYSVRISSTHEGDIPLVITVDEEIIYDGVLGVRSFNFIRSFDVGEHVITATISQDDHFKQNNAFVKTISVIDKPRVLYVANKASGLEKIASELYAVDSSLRVPEELDEYYAIILNDVPRGVISDEDALVRFITGGNGVVVIGGENSYEYGQYKGSLLETYLPVTVGAGTRTQGGANIVISIDLSSSTLGSVRQERRIRNGEVEFVEIETTGEIQSLEKALAISVIEVLNPSNKVGVLGFTYPLPGRTPEACSGACVIQPVESLAKNKEAIIDRISRVDIAGGTALWMGIEGALELLEDKKGSRNIVYISDGISSPVDQERAFNAARVLAAMGGKLYAVQVGDSQDGEVTLKELALAGNGAYFKATQANKLTVLFGEPVDIDQGDAFDLFVLNQYHFITQGLNTEATLFGYNQVAPKKGAQLLITSHGGDPVLTVWSYGIGRVASLTAFNGPDLGQLMTAQNTRVLSKTINWAIGNPERKEGYSINLPDTRINKEVMINITSDKPPNAPGYDFEQIGRETYVTSFSPAGMGLFEAIGTKYGVNYERELQGVGYNPFLQRDIEAGGGKVFRPDQVDLVVEHIQTLQQLSKTEQEELGWLVLLAGLAFFLLEIFIRRIGDMRRKK